MTANSNAPLQLLERSIALQDPHRELTLILGCSQDVKRINVPSRRLQCRAGFMLARGRRHSQGPISPPGTPTATFPGLTHTKMHFP